MAFFSEQRKHSLRSYPEYEPKGRRCGYLDIPGAKILAQFRLGDAELGNRNHPPIETCPLCGNGRNIESHLVFACKSVEGLWEQAEGKKGLKDFFESTVGLDDNVRLKMFVGGDLSSNDILQKRCQFLDKVKEAHAEALSRLQNSPEDGCRLQEEWDVWECNKCTYTTKSQNGLRIHIARVH